jgi:hypothetical protein
VRLLGEQFPYWSLIVAFFSCYSNNVFFFREKKQGGRVREEGNFRPHEAFFADRSDN